MNGTEMDNEDQIMCPYCSYDMAGHVLPAKCPECSNDISQELLSDLTSSWSKRRVLKKAFWPSLIIIAGALFLILFHSVKGIALLSLISIEIGILALGVTVLLSTHATFRNPKVIAALRIRGESALTRYLMVWASVFVFSGLLAVVWVCINWILDPASTR